MPELWPKVEKDIMEALANAATLDTKTPTGMDLTLLFGLLEKYHPHYRESKVKKTNIFYNVPFDIPFFTKYDKPLLQFLNTLAFDLRYAGRTISAETDEKLKQLDIPDKVSPFSFRDESVRRVRDIRQSNWGQAVIAAKNLMNSDPDNPRSTKHLTQETALLPHIWRIEPAFYNGHVEIVTTFGFGNLTALTSTEMASGDPKTRTTIEFRDQQDQSPVILANRSRNLPFTAGFLITEAAKRIGI